MSMLSAQIDHLRELADALDGKYGYQGYEIAMRDAADTICELRELCRRYGEYISQDRCEGCVYKTRCNNGLIDECWQLGEIRDLASKLGVEADG